MLSVICEIITKDFPSIILSIAAIYLGWQQNKLNKDNTEKELFKDFNTRYSNLNDKLYKLKIKDMESITKDQLLYDVAMEFFNLCAEEYYWKKKDRISDEIWKSWHRGMNSWLQQAPVLCELWESEMTFSGPESYYIKDKYEFFDKSNFKKI
jgi:hypothetical protein